MKHGGKYILKSGIIASANRSFFDKGHLKVEKPCPEQDCFFFLLLACNLSHTRTKFYFETFSVANLLKPLLLVNVLKCIKIRPLKVKLRS